MILKVVNGLQRSVKLSMSNDEFKFSISFWLIATNPAINTKLKSISMHSMMDHTSVKKTIGFLRLISFV